MNENLRLSGELDHLARKCRELVELGDLVGSERLEYADIEIMHILSDFVLRSIHSGFNETIRDLLLPPNIRSQLDHEAARKMNALPKMSDMVMLGSLPTISVYSTYLWALRFTISEQEALRDLITNP